MKKLLIALVLLFSFSSCAAPIVPGAPPIEAIVEDGNITALFESGGLSLYRFIDEKAGVVCYLYRDNWELGGLDCLPINETRLDR